MDKALSFFHKAIQRDENLADAWYAIALILDFQSRDMEAKYYIKKALELNADNVDYWFTYAEIQEKIGFIEEAEIAYKKVIELENFEPEIWLNYSNLLYQHQHQKEAIDVLYEGIKYHPESADIVYRLSAYLFNQGDDSKALTYFQDALN